MTKKDYYEVLNVSKTASADEIVFFVMRNFQFINTLGYCAKAKKALEKDLYG